MNLTWTVILIQNGAIQQKLTASTKKEAHRLIPWTKINAGKGRIQKLPGHIYLVSYS